MSETPRRNKWLSAVAQSADLPPTCASVAIGMAMGCSDRNLKPAWPGMSAIAIRAGCSKDSARRSVRALETAGFLEIETGNGARSSRYVFLLPAIAESSSADNGPPSKLPPVAKSGGVAKTVAPPLQKHPRGGGKTASGGVAKPLPNPLKEPQEDPREGTPLCDGLPFGSDQFDAFENFWSVYPRPEGEADARKEWTAAVKIEEPETIIERAQAYRAHRGAVSDTPGEAYRYSMSPSRWLREERWKDPIPNIPASNQNAFLQRVMTNAQAEAFAYAKFEDEW